MRVPFIFTFEIFPKTCEKRKMKKFEESKNSKGKRAETKEDERRKANKPSKNQNQRKWKNRAANYEAKG